MDNDFKFLKGNIETIILNALYGGDKYGYEIAKEIKSKTDNKYEIKQPTLYSYLKRLQEQNLVESYWGEESFGGRRKYFKLTSLGRSTCEQYMSEWNFHKSILDSLVAEPDDELPEYTPQANVFLGKKTRSTRRPKKDAKSREEEQQLIFEELKKLSQPQEEESSLPIEEQQPAAEAEETVVQEETLQEDPVAAEEQITERIIRDEIYVSSDTYSQDTTVIEEESPVYVTEQEYQTEEQTIVYNEPVVERTAEETATTEIIHQDEVEEPVEQQEELIRISSDEKFAPKEMLEEAKSSASTDAATQRDYAVQDQPEETEQEKQYKSILGGLLGDQIYNIDDKMSQISTQLASYKSEAESDNLTVSEYADNLSKEGYRIRFYNNATSHYRAVPMLLKNKINCATAWTTLAAFYLLTALAWIIGGSSVNLLVIGLVALAFLLIPLYFTYSYVSKPMIRIKSMHNFKRSLINKIVVFVFISAIIVCADLLIFKIDFGNIGEIIHTFFIPEFAAAMLIVSELIYKLYLQQKTFYN